MGNENVNVKKWTISFLSILIGTFVFIIVVPLFLGFPLNYLPILVGVGCIIIAILYKRFVKKD